MKLKDGFITMETEGEQIMVSSGGNRFNGLIRSNKTAAFIVDCLKSETSKEAIVDAMAAQYDAPRQILAEDVERIVSILQSVDAIDG